MRKLFYCMLTAIMLTSLLAGCSRKPSMVDVYSALEGGTLTLEDALAKGYVDEEWATQYTENKSIPASNKFSANQLTPFTTKDMNGNDFTFTPSDIPVLFLFANPANEESLANIQAVDAIYEDIKASGGDAVIVLMGQQVPEELASLSVPAIFYTDELKTLLGNSKEMIDGNDLAASWNMKGSFITAWYRTLDKADLPQTAKDLLEAFASPADLPDEKVG